MASTLLASSATAAAAAARNAAGNANASSGLMKWAAGGWVLFVAENAVLSENRTYLIEQVFGGSDETYHAVYGACSTAALASILWGYRKLRLAAASSTATAPPAPLSPLRLGLAFVPLGLGLALASQGAPKLQVPVEILTASSSSNDNKNAAPANTTSETEQQQDSVTNSTPPAAAGSWNLKVRCPFDFTDNQHNRNSDSGEEEVHGLDRVSRHPGLWAFGLAAAGNAWLQPTLPLAVWMLGPLAVAWIGGAHTDSRYRRHVGGTLHPWYAAQTSNVPFAAALTGRQGDPRRALQKWTSEEERFKPLNAAVAMAAAGVWVVLAAARRRGRGASPAAGLDSFVRRRSATASSSNGA